MNVKNRFSRIRLNGPTESLNVVVASGPFTCSTDLDYEPLKDLLVSFSPFYLVTFSTE
jgi:hypothetical protein